MRKAFDTVEHEKVIEALLHSGVPQEYCALLRLLYANQRGSVHGSKEFHIQRGVKQGDTLSAILFNCVLDLAFKN